MKSKLLIFGILILSVVGIILFWVKYEDLPKIVAGCEKITDNAMKDMCYRDV